MNKLTIAATALFLASTAAAHAGNAISFQIEGQNIRIETPRNCASLNCVTIVAPGLSDKPIKLNNINLKGLGSKDDDVDTTPAPATTAQPAPAPVQQHPVQQPPVQATAPAAPAIAAPSTTVAAVPSVGYDATTQTAPVAAPAPAPAPVAVAPAPVPAAPVAVANTPIGVWATEENKGNVRVEQCGVNLCGYAAKTNERILINMKPDGAKWSGRIHDPDSGRNYDSTIAMKGPNAMRVQGCAFGGMFCGGQTWKRVS
ncbi:hypothetical protein BST63_30435 [Bradyrhizobium canariense]|jgi:uncharacterized protein (DUF2147 family)|uniref:DUF2147 domain-containing protein n=1 Tax=Bradyrhizobium canariense TaxID=255045 RepID=A0ABX3WW37_9BRAD|nr:MULTISPECIES: DUF2147 domain-containing protein [Bradyrhizobium]MCK1295660.1 DUF2147 domain-containing protein [Bradyrhizobium sp. 30]MCK1415096.1 DUF2147 domain-containing protein [Bradyrhizobium sp. CW4]MCK1472620.1 DUF2147 domain-containing protein [Bradyrhizobium sp. CW10]OSI62017.1 hypothetical protein BSZ21_29435 [Bradyrhizobium canariense]OSJ08670.1 hypothetical protein BSR47_34625 [Bradyrhizobium canariense]